jgi:hypothetical protein
MESVTKWLDDYVAAWKSYDADAIRVLFSDNAEYRYNPYDEPTVGREAIVEDWLSDRDEPNSFEADYLPIAVNGNTAVARGQTQYFDTDTREITSEYDNIFLLKFNDQGECESFTEWYMEPRDEDEE